MNSTELIGRARERWNEIDHEGLDYRSFYNGWLEGRIDLTFPIDSIEKMQTEKSIVTLIEQLSLMAAESEADTMLDKVYKSGIVTAINEIEKVKATL